MKIESQLLVIDGVYASAYNMHAGSEQVIVGDVISLTTNDSGDTVIGSGELGENGLKMCLALGLLSLAGKWEECDAADEPAFGGQVEFCAEPGGRLVGYWSMPGQGDMLPLSGTWVMSKIDDLLPHNI